MPINLALISSKLGKLAIVFISSTERDFSEIPPPIILIFSESFENFAKIFAGKIESSDVALKGQTVSSSYKPATLDNGLNIQVPPFIEAGDEIVVDTRNLEYIKKI